MARKPLKSALKRHDMRFYGGGKVHIDWVLIGMLAASGVAWGAIIYHVVHPPT
jgi:hypothetical protein